MTHIEQLEQQLEQAKQASQPHVTQIIESSRDQIVTKNQTTGTVRTDLLGGDEPERLDARPVKQPEIPLIEKDLDAGTGKVIERTAGSLTTPGKRVSELNNSKTIRVDLGSQASAALQDSVA